MSKVKMDPLAQGGTATIQVSSAHHPLGYAVGSMSMSAPDRMFLECQTVLTLPSDPVDAQFKCHVNQHGRLRSTTPTPTPTPRTGHVTRHLPPDRAPTSDSDPGYMSRNFETFERINSIREKTNILNHVTQ